MTKLNVIATTTNTKPKQYIKQVNHVQKLKPTKSKSAWWPLLRTLSSQETDWFCYGPNWLPIKGSHWRAWVSGL